MARTKKQDISNEKEKPVWLKYTADEVKAIILKLANKGLTSEKIGLVLRDQYGIPKVSLYDIKIKDVLANKYEDQNIINLNKKVTALELHNKKFRGDQKAKRSLTISKAKLKKRVEYLEN